MKIAVVHEWFEKYAGSERVLEQILHLFPDADVYGVVDFLSKEDGAFLGGRKVRTSFIQNMPFARRFFRHYLALMPLAVEQFDLRSYDLIISSSHAVSKGVLSGPDQLHISYVHSPIRYAWDLQHQYLQESGLRRGVKSVLVRAMLHYLRLWDCRTAFSVDLFLANSAFIGRRIRKFYGRESTVVYPPVDVEAFALHVEKDDYYLTASRMVPYKKMPVIVEAFSRMPDKRLVVIGDGPDLGRCRELATANVEILGFQEFGSLRSHMQRAKAFVFAAEEDFGITVVEAQACGTPVIAYGRGGARETVRDLADSATPTGLLFEEQTADAIVAAVERFEASGGAISALDCRRNAERFSISSFRERFEAQVRDRLERHRSMRKGIPA